MFKLLTHRMFPGCCCLCDGPGYKGLDLCEVCLKCLPINAVCCSRCAAPLEHASLEGMILCGSCLREKSPITQTVAAYIFDFPTDYIVRSLKFKGEEKYARLIGGLLAQHVEDMQVSVPDCLIPVPLHRRRYLERGFNQAELIAAYCGSRLGLPIIRKALIRCRNTPPQTGFGRRLRHKNLKGAFQVVSGTSLPKHIALIDDVITTGSTVREISKLLVQSGVERIDVWAFARAVN